NIVYRYSVTAPAGQNVIVGDQLFYLQNGRWDSPQLAIYSDSGFSNLTDTWNADPEDNSTNGNSATLRGSLTIPAGQTVYFELSMFLGAPSQQYNVYVQNTHLPQVTLTWCDPNGCNS